MISKYQAYRIRKRLRDGQHVSMEEQGQLAQYDANKSRRRKAKATKPKPLDTPPGDPTEGSVTAPDPEPPSPPPATPETSPGPGKPEEASKLSGAFTAPKTVERPPTAEPGPTPPKVTDNDSTPTRRVIDFSVAPPATTQKKDGEPQGKCGDANCLKCYGPVKNLCQVHGTPIYPRMNTNAARFYASMALAAIDKLIQAKAPDVQLSEVPPAKVDALAQGFIDFTWKRVPWVTEWDDIAVVAGVPATHVFDRAGEIRQQRALKKGEKK